jgi:hypothetical protein
MESPDSKEETRGVELANEIFSFKELITIVVDYYCFKNNIEEDDEKEGDDWKIGTKYENGEDEIIPEEINSLIEQAFKTQLNKFIKS